MARKATSILGCVPDATRILMFHEIDGEEYLYDACEYVVLNSVRAWLCGRVEDWPWSYSRFGLAATPPGARPSGP